MANNTDEEHLDIPTNTQTENPPDEITPTANDTDIITNQETENMEVHKHPHHVMHKKKWSEYLLEFFMLFLAVFLGFIAENVREGTVESHREKEYIESMIKDLRTDTANLSTVITQYQIIVDKQDSLLNTYDLIDNGGNKNFIRLYDYFQGYPDFVNADATIQQLKNSGGFRLIKNKTVVDSIIAYTASVNKTFINTNTLNTISIDLKNFQGSFISSLTLKKAREKGLDLDNLQEQKMSIFISKDIADKERLFGKLNYYSFLMKGISRVNLIPLSQQATRLIVFLQNEYHLDKK